MSKTRLFIFDKHDAPHSHTPSATRSILAHTTYEILLNNYRRPCGGRGCDGGHHRRNDRNETRVHHKVILLDEVRAEDRNYHASHRV